MSPPTRVGPIWSNSWFTGISTPHRAGEVDPKYVDGLKAATGQDITKELSRLGYPEEHIYWFEPLKQLTAFIHAARQFFASLPDPPVLERPGIAGPVR